MKSRRGGTIGSGTESGMRTEIGTGTEKGAETGGGTIEIEVGMTIAGLLGG
jgi:hypothetical protein